MLGAGDKEEDDSDDQRRWLAPRQETKNKIEETSCRLKRGDTYTKDSNFLFGKVEGAERDIHRFLRFGREDQDQDRDQDQPGDGRLQFDNGTQRRRC